MELPAPAGKRISSNRLVTSPEVDKKGKDSPAGFTARPSGEASASKFAGAKQGDANSNFYMKIMFFIRSPYREFESVSVFNAG